MRTFDAATLSPVVVAVGHYGAGKTNLVLNLAADAAAAGREVVVVDLDVVNPYFRSSDFAGELEHSGVRLIAPRFAGTTLDSPGISGQVEVAIDWARQVPGRLVLVDAGGDDVGATALGRFSAQVAAGPYEMLYVVNRSRNLTRLAADAVRVLREIEGACRLAATAVANNTHLAGDTDADVLASGEAFACEAAQLAGLPLAFSAVERGLLAAGEAECAGLAGLVYPIDVRVRKPWE